MKRLIAIYIGVFICSVSGCFEIACAGQSDCSAVLHCLDIGDVDCAIKSIKDGKSGNAAVSFATVQTAKECAYFIGRFYLEKNDSENAIKWLEYARKYSSPDSRLLIDILYDMLLIDPSASDNPESDFRHIQRAEPEKAAMLKTRIKARFQKNLQAYIQKPLSTPCPAMHDFWLKFFDTPPPPIQQMCQDMHQLEMLEKGVPDKDTTDRIVRVLERLVRWVRSEGILTEKLKAYSDLSACYHYMEYADKKEDPAMQLKAFTAAKHHLEKIDPDVLSVPQRIHADIGCKIRRCELESDIALFLTQSPGVDGKTLEKLLTRAENFSRTDCNLRKNFYKTPLKLIQQYRGITSEEKMVLSAADEQIAFVQSPLWQRDFYKKDNLLPLKAVVESQIRSKVNLVMADIQNFLTKQPNEHGFSFNSVSDCAKTLSLLEKNYAVYSDTMRLRSDMETIVEIESMIEGGKLEEAKKILDNHPSNILSARFAESFSEKIDCRHVALQLSKRSSELLGSSSENSETSLRKLRHAYQSITDKEKKQCVNHIDFNNAIQEIRLRYFHETMRMAYDCLKKKQWEKGRRILDDFIDENIMAFDPTSSEYRYADKKRRLFSAVIKSLPEKRRPAGIEKFFDGSDRDDYRAFKNEKNYIESLFHPVKKKKLIKTKEKPVDPALSHINRLKMRRDKLGTCTKPASPDKQAQVSRFLGEIVMGYLPKLRQDEESKRLFVEYYNIFKALQFCLEENKRQGFQDSFDVYYRTNIAPSK